MKWSLQISQKLKKSCFLLTTFTKIKNIQKIFIYGLIYCNVLCAKCLSVYTENLKMIGCLVKKLCTKMLSREVTDTDW